MPEPIDRLRVAIVAGCLGVGGAEKQLVMAVQALLDAGVCVEVYSFRSGEFYEQRLASLGIECAWLGDRRLERLRQLRKASRRFRPHILQSGHMFVNLYVALVGRLSSRSLTVGALRSSFDTAVTDLGKWSTHQSIRLPHALIVNSLSAFDAVKSQNVVAAERIHCLPNAIDVDGYSPKPDSTSSDGRITATFVGRLDRNKRVDLFIEALSKARETTPTLRGCVIGDGPELDNLRTLAKRRRLDDEHLSFLGRRSDVPDLLTASELSVLCSEEEGMPNVILEAMAAGLPILTTPAGDAGSLVRDAGAGCVVPFGDREALTNGMIRMAESPGLRSEMGRRGRNYVMSRHSVQSLGSNLLSIYRKIAEQQSNESIQRLVDAHLLQVRGPMQPEAELVESSATVERPTFERPKP